MNIELTGFNGHGWRVCYTCPCEHEGECWFEYERKEGYLHFGTGHVVTAMQAVITEQEYTVGAGWYYVTIRPQECIDKHGK